MPAYFNLTLDTTAPSSVVLTLEGGASFAPQQLIDVSITTADTPTTGYQMLIWGDVDGAYDADIQTLEINSSWITYNGSKQIKLSSTDALKTVYAKIRDDVYNESAQVSDTITLDTAIPVATITGPDVSKISKITGKKTSSFSFIGNEIFDEYKIKVVLSTGASNDTGTLILTTNGSINMNGTAGSYPSGTPINCQINGADLEVASSGDGIKIIKVFIKDAAGSWSV